MSDDFDRRRILVVDDEERMVRFIRMNLEHDGFQVSEAFNGKQAIQRLRDINPDLILLDVMMPDIDGFEVLETIREASTVPVIMLTAKGEEDDRVRGLELGADDYITKPFDFQELHLRVHNALQRTAQRPLVNRVTNLPQGRLVDERLEACLSSQGWAILCITVENLEAFQEAYGFIAADDALRAIGLIVSSAAGKQDFTGHLSDTRLIVVTLLDNLTILKEYIQAHLEEKMDYFYPLNDIHDPSMKERKLSVQVTGLAAAQGPFNGLNDLKERLH
jgi:DNA-binding response OmpR family regulator